MHVLWTSGESCIGTVQVLHACCMCAILSWDSCHMCGIVVGGKVRYGYYVMAMLALYLLYMRVQHHVGIIC